MFSMLSAVSMRVWGYLGIALGALFVLFKVRQSGADKEKLKQTLQAARVIEGQRDAAVNRPKDKADVKDRLGSGRF